MIQLSIAPLPSQTIYAVLAGQNCTIKIYQRGDFLYLDLWTTAGDICRGAICQNGADVIQSPSTIFKGSLHFFDSRGQSPPQWSGLGSRFVMVFVPAGGELPDYLQF